MKDPSYNPFAEAGFYKSVLQKTSDKEDKERLRKIENTKRLREALKVVDYTKHYDLDPDALQDLIDEGLLDLSKKEAYFKKQEVPKLKQTITRKANTTSYRRIDKEKPDTLQKMEYVDEEHKQAAQLAGKSIREYIDMMEVHFIDVTENGYFSADKNTQKEYMLGLEVLKKITKPAIDNRYVMGGFEDYVDPISEYLRKSQHWPEHPEFVRDYRYQMLPNGTFEDKYEYTKSHILGGHIIPIINDVIFIKNNFPFLKAFYKNHFEAKYQALQNREKDEKESKENEGINKK